jgi:Mn2+/Fe2+ NRAMP family transporter
VRARIGSEVLAAAADNDPTNVGTAVLVGARTGYQLSWVALLVAPLLAVVLVISAHVGMASRSDLQSLIRKYHGHGLARLVLVSVVLVNLVTMAADLQAGAAGIGMLAGTGSGWFVLPLGLAVVGLLLIGKYDEIVAVLRYALVGFLAFGAAAVLAHPDWAQVLRGSLIPVLSLRPEDLGGALAILGTTLTSYVYVWETISAGVEKPPGHRTAASALAQSRIGAVIGSGFTAVIFWFMLVASGATLGRHHATAVSLQAAAGTLRPVAGSLAAGLFAAGLIASAVVALPILMATTAYVVGAEFDWRTGLSEPVSHARGFYAILVASVAIAAAVDLAGVPLLDTLVAASVIGGLGTPLPMVMLIRLARNREAMGGKLISARLAAAGWTIAAGVGGLGLLYAIAALLGVF